MGERMRINLFKWWLYITIVPKLGLREDRCWNCGSKSIMWKRRTPEGSQKGVCLRCGKVGYKFGNRY